MQRKFITYCFLFFLPIVILYLTVEWFTLSIPSTFSVNEAYLEKDAENIETLVLGPSHLTNAINAEWLKSPTINLSSGNQYIDTDYKLYQGIHQKLPSLKNIVLEVSYSHFEIAPNGKDFWKNNLYYKYYGVNCFERTTYFKDKLIFLSNPSFFSEKLKSHYYTKKRLPNFNKYAFNFTDGYERFNRLNYEKEKIDSLKRFRINTEANSKFFKENTTQLFNFLDTLVKHQRNIIITTAPMYSTYLQKRNPDILHRRDSILNVIQNKYPGVHFLKTEEDSLNFTLNEFWNHSHLNPKGAKIFTKKLDSILQRLN